MMHHVLCVANQEALAERLGDAVTCLAEVLVVGICGPDEAPTVARVVGASLIVTLHGTPLADAEAMGVPVLVVAPNADPAEVVRSYLAARTVPVAESEEVTASTPELIPAHRHARVRLGLYGSRGGVGVTTAAVTAARLLADKGRRVALYDAAGRGDAALFLGLTPSEQPVTAGRITVYSGLPETDEALATCDALIVDGGRERRPVAARWILLDKPPAESDVARRLGLIDGPPEGLSQ
jgi:hypothetical protein